MTILLTMLAPLLLGGQTAAAAEPAFREALVFSVADRAALDGYEERPQQFETRFVGLRANGRHETLDLPHLLIPREGGFAALVVERECRTSEVVETDDLFTCADTVRFARPPGQGYPQGDRFPPVCEYDYATVVFASPSFVATYNRNGATEGCNPRSWSWSERWGVVRLGSESLPSEDVRFSDLFGAAGRAAYAKAATSALNHSQGAEVPGPQDETCSASKDEETSWTVRRARTAWVARLMQQDTPLCQPEADLPIPVGRRLTGQDERAITWDSVLRAVPDAQEAFGSPGESLALVASAARIEVFDRRASPWRLLASWPRASVVAVQWARGDEARRWRRLLRDLDR